MKPDTENIYQRKINQVIDYINANLHLPLRLDIIAGQVNVSERQLLRIMKGALNESLYAYVARQRVERAVLYMHTEDMSLADLASRVGYDNPQSFSKAFKKQFSVSPKAYMDKLRARLREETEKWSNPHDLEVEVCEVDDLDLVYIRIFGKYGEKMDLMKFMTGSGILCVICYLLTTLSSNPVIGLTGCIVCGFSVGIMWPGTISISSKKFPMGGTAMFALLAMAGDLGGSIGPGIVGYVTQNSDNNIRVGMGIGLIFPLVLLIMLFILCKGKKTQE